MSIQPINPDVIQDVKNSKIPDEIIEAFNELIVENWSGGLAVIKQNEALTRIAGKTAISRSDIFSKNYLDIEDIFRKAGWKVVYDKPAYNENYEAFWKFSKK